MSKFNIGDKVTSKGYPYLGEEVGVVAGIDLGEEIGAGKYLVKFDSLDICSGWACGIFRNDPDLIIEPYEGYAEWVDEDDLVKVEDKCEKGAMREFNIGDKVISKEYPSLVKEVGVIVGIDTREDIEGKYLVKFDSLSKNEGWEYKIFRNSLYRIIEPYEGYAVWLDDIEKVEEKCEEEEDIKTKFTKNREQKEEAIKEKSEKVSEFNIGDKVFLKNYNRPEGEVVGIDLVNDINKYLVKSDSLGTSIGWTFEEAKENFDETLYNIIYYEGYAIWTNNIEKIEEAKEKIEETIEDTDINNIKGTSHFIKVDTEKEFEDYILDEYKKLREQKKETIKEMEAEIEKIRKEWNL